MAKRGRPLKFKSPEELKTRIDEYFEHCKTATITKYFVSKGQVIAQEIPEPKTMSGLAVFLDCDRRNLVNYTDRDEFFPILLRAKQRIEQDNIANGLSGTYENRINALNLCSNFGFSMKSEDTVRVENLESVLQNLGVEQDDDDGQTSE